MDWRLEEIALSADGEAQKRLVGGVPFRTRKEAARYAAVLVKTYSRNGYDWWRRRWWSEDNLGERIHFALVYEPSLCKAPLP